MSLATAYSFVRDSLRSHVRGPFAAELAESQRTIILSRVVVLVWVACFMIPFAVTLLVWLTAPNRLHEAMPIVGASLVAIFVVRTLVLRGVFDRHASLAVLVLVGGIFGPVAGSVTELIHADGASFFFSYFLICLAFVSLFPMMEVAWVVAVSVALILSYVGATAFRAHFMLDHTFTTNVLYMIDLTVLNIIFNRVGATLFFDERKARFELRGARDALLGEMAVAQEIQTLLLPIDATLPGHLVHGVMIPADEVGGDYFDVVETTHGRRFIAIGDVSGHGVTSGLTMMMARSSLLGSLESDPTATLAELYSSLNTALRGNLARMRLRLFMTFLLIEDLGAGNYRAIGAHLPLFIWRRATLSVEEVDVQGVWLGVLDHVPPDMVPTRDFELGPEDHMLLYTDGIVESMKDDEMFGGARLKEIFRTSASGGPGHAVKAIFGAVESFGGDRSDDRTLLAVQYTGIA